MFFPQPLVGLNDFIMYLWSEAGPAWFRVDAPLVNSFEFSQDYSVVGFQDLNVMSMSITGEERNTWDIWQEEEMRLLNSRVIIQSDL